MRYQEQENSQRKEVEQRLQGAGRRGKWLCYYLRDTEFQSGMMKNYGNGQW